MFAVCEKGIIMNKQEIFDKVYLGLKSQGFKRSIRVDDNNDDIVCMYRSPQGYKCAAGWLIPDDLYDECLEGCSVLGGHVRQVFEQLGVSRLDLPFIQQLQRIHDFNFNLTARDMVNQDKLEEIAVHHGLTVPQGDNHV